MKSLVAGLVLIIVLGLAGFFYRNVAERTGGPAAPVACTMEAKLCPDGSSVGRQGSDCAFAACAFPNVQDPAIGIAFAVPPGYEVDDKASLSDGESVRVNYARSPAGPSSGRITVRVFPILEGKTAEDVMLANSKHLTADMPAKSMSEFKPVLINGRTFQSFIADRFEGQITSYYYLVRQTDVLRFDITESNVDWTNPDLVVGNLPEHKNLLSMLATLQTL